MKGLVVPEASEDFTADEVELFFDLAFVFAFSQLVSHLIHNHDGTGVAKGGLLFLMLWLPWTQFTWSANAVSSSARVVRALFLVATVASVPMAASVESAFDDGGPAFAISLSVILAMGLLAMISGVETGSPAWNAAVAYSVPNFVAIVIVIAGSFLDDSARITAWCAGMLIVLYGTVRAGSGEWIIRPGHFAERHGLIVIVALGEVVVAVGLPVVSSLSDGEGVPGRTAAALVGSGVFASLLWWGYFDRPARAFEHRAELHDGVHRGRYARDVYTYAHAPIVAGIILSAAALEEITLHPKDPLEATFRWMLFGGLVLFLGGVGAAVARAFGVAAMERLVAAVVVGAILASTGSVDGLVVLLLLDAVLAVMLVVEHLRIEVAPSRS